MKTITICNLKGGGATKTTTAVHIASALGRLGHKTALYDSDPQGTATRWAQLAPDLPYRTIASIDDSRGKNEYIVIDTPPGFIDIIQSATALADLIVIPMSPAAMSIDRLIPTIQLISTSTTKNPEVKILLTQVRRGTHTVLAAREYLAERGFPVCQIEIPMRVAIERSFGTVPKDGPYSELAEELLREMA